MISICVGVVVGCGASLMCPTDGLMVLDLACTLHLSYKFEMNIEVHIGFTWQNIAKSIIRTWTTWDMKKIWLHVYGLF
jgi:hypothetical protein